MSKDNKKTEKFSIGVNVAPMACLNDLNKLLKVINPIVKEMPWKHWEDIMSCPNTFLITCFDDKNNEVIAMATLLIIRKPSGSLALVSDEANLNKFHWTIETLITTAILDKAKELAKEHKVILKHEVNVLSFIS